MRRSNGPLTPLRLLGASLLAVPAACSNAPRTDLVGKWDCHEVQPTPYEEMDFALTVAPDGAYTVEAEADGQFEEGRFRFAFTGSGRLTTPKDQFIAAYKTVDVHAASMDGVEYTEEQREAVAREILDAVGYTFTIDRLTADELAMHDRTSHTVCARMEG